jgi:hypothetical protein
VLLLAYLALTLDKGLIWKEQLDKVTNKGYRAFWTCRDMFGRIWALRPKVMHWIYTVVVRPIVIYAAAAVWWPGVNFRKSRAELSKLQRLACLGITGAMRIAPTAAIGVLLGLPPLHCSWRLRPEQKFIESTAAINRNPNLKVLEKHIGLRA